MSNDIKRKQSVVIAVVRAERHPARPSRPVVRGTSGGVGSAWCAAVALLLALLGLAALLPAPTELLTVSGRGPSAVDAVVLAGTALLVWALTAWVAVVVAVAALGVLPGALGRHARRLLRMIAPRLALRLVAVAVGASALAGTTACSAPIFASTTAPDSVSVAEHQASMVTPSPQVFDPAAPVTATVPAAGGPTGSGSAVITDPTVDPVVIDPVVIDPVVIDIDWPSSTTSASGSIDPPVASSATPSPIPADSPATTAPTATTSAAATTTPPASASAPSATVITPVSPTGGTTTAAPRPAPNDPAPPAGSTDRAAAEPTVDAPDLRGADRTGASPTRPSGESIVVRPGDTLWALAADALPAGADDAAVDAAWRQWYSLNRDVIGDDPDLLQPGEQLTPPPADPPTVEENDR